MASSVTIKVISNRLPSIPAKLHSAVSAEVEKSARRIEADSKGLAPVLTGTLRRSIHADIQGMKAIVGPSVDYGIYVEMGARGRAPRPFMRPAASKELPQFAANVKKALGSL